MMFLGNGGSNFRNRSSESFCKCVPQTDLNCGCAEDHTVNWTWEHREYNRQVEVSNNDRDVRFHPGYSSGTAAVRGKTAFQQGYHHFWEIKMLTSLYGTDVMVGVGTDRVKLRIWAYRFCSILGQDDQSWGYSYRGGVQHRGRFLDYGPRFGQGSLIGIHLNMVHGTLEYFHNRKPLGIAFTGLTSRNLYPMISSTAARSAMRVVSAVSYPQNLQLDCLLTLCRHPELQKELNHIPGLRKVVTDFWWCMTPRIDDLEDSQDTSTTYVIEKDAVDPSKQPRKRKTDPLWGSTHSNKPESPAKKYRACMALVLPASEEEHQS